MWSSSAGDDQRNIHQMFGQEPNLQFIGPDNTAHQQVVGAVVAQLGGFPGRGT